MRKLLLLLAVFLLSTVHVFAQTRTVTGTVTDESGVPIANVSVLIKGASTGTTTDNVGHFSINVPENRSIIVFSAVGFAEKELSVTQSETVSVTLASTTAAMDEVVIVGYGSGKKIGNVVGSVAKIDGKVIENKPVANILDAMQGKVAGLQLFNSSGEPSALPSIRLHGNGSLGASSTPLFVLDGLPVDPSTIRTLNSMDIEDITVLKDASSTSIYGSRAANGVVYYTTKKGKIGETATVTLNTQYGISNLINKDFFNNFMNTKQLTDFWVAVGYRTQAQVDALLKTYPFDTKWYKVYYKPNAPTFQTDISISGGSGKTRYFVSGNYFNQEGLAYRSGYNRYSFRSNVTSTINKWLKFGLNLFGGHEKFQANPYGSNSTNRGLALLAQPFYSPTDTNGVEYPDLIPGWNRYNPKYLADKNPSDIGIFHLTPIGFIELSPLKGLTLKTQGGYDFFDTRTTTIRLPSNVSSLNNGSTFEGFDRIVGRTITNTAEYILNVNNTHNVTALAGQEYTDNVGTGFTGTSTGQTDDRLTLLSNGPSNKDVTSYKVEYAFNSYFGRLEYNYSTKYYADVSLRTDASSRFGVNNRNATFWSAGLMWNAKKEKFLRNIDWLKELAIKVSTGTSGNADIGNYQSYALVGTNQYGDQTGWIINNPGDPSLTWEKQRLTSLELTFNLFDRSKFNIELYDRFTKSMLTDVPYPYTSGFASITKNVGGLKNTGIDISINVDVIKQTDLKVTPYFRFNYNKEKVTELFQGRQYWIIPNTGVSWAVGQPRSYFYPVFYRVNPDNGNPEWYLPNSNPDLIVNPQFDATKTSTTFSAAALQQSTGIKRYPPINGGFGFESEYKGVYLNTDFAYSLGKYLINNDRYFFENPNQFAGFNQSATILDYWKKAGDIARFPKYGIQFTQFDSRLIEDASFMRMKALTIGYKLPSSLLERTKFIKSFKIFAVGRNLITVTKYSGPDPEVDSNLTLGVNPNTKQFTGGVQIQF